MKYKFFETVIASSVYKLNSLYKNYGIVSNEVRTQPFPVLIQSVGDEAYMANNSDRLDKVNSKVSLPAMILELKNINIDESSLTNEAKGSLVIKNQGFEKEFVGNVKPFPCEIIFEAVLMYSDIFQYFSFIEYNMNGVYKNKPFSFEYMGKRLSGTITVESTDHDVDYSISSTWLEIGEISPYQASINFKINTTYPSFELNKLLKPNIDINGDGIETGGVGLPTNPNDGNPITDDDGNPITDDDGNPITDDDGGGLIDKGNIIKGIVHYTDENNIDNKVAKIIVGDFPKNKIKKLNNEKD